MDTIRSAINSPLSPLTPAACKESPGKCLRQVILDASIFVGIYCMLLQQLKQPQPTLDQIITFVTIYTTTVYACKALSVEYHDLPARVLGMALFTKVLTVMIPPSSS
jgi:hypothetical protein